MNKNLAHLIADYQTSVVVAVELMVQSGIPLPATNTAWSVADIPHRGQLEGGIPYFKHGYGCAVSLPSGKVDFDFGEHGEINGFDAWRLARYADSHLQEYGFVNEAALKDCFRAAVVAGSLVHSGRNLHYIANAV